MSDSTEKESSPLQDDTSFHPKKDLAVTPQKARKKKSRKFIKKAASWAFDIAVVIIILLVVFWWQTRSLVPTGEPAPDFTLNLYQPNSSETKTVSLKELSGKQTIIAFWAPWCSVCRAEVSTINSLKRILGDEANVYTIVLDYSSFSEIQDFINDLDLKAPVLLGTPAVAAAYKVNSFPTVYMLSADGKVINHTVGYSTQMGIRARLLAGEWFN